MEEDKKWWFGIQKGERGRKMRIKDLYKILEKEERGRKRIL